MKIQTTILNFVTSAKNQEKIQDKLQNLNVPRQQQQNLLSQHMHFSREQNNCQNQPESFSNERSNTK